MEMNLVLTDQYKEKIYSNATEQLIQQLHESLFPHLSLIPEHPSQFHDITAQILVKAHNLVLTENIRNPESFTELKSLNKYEAWESKRIVDSLFPVLFRKSVKLLSKEFKDFSRKEYSECSWIDGVETDLKLLKDKVFSGLTRVDSTLFNQDGIEIVLKDKLSKNLLIVVDDHYFGRKLSSLLIDIKLCLAPIFRRDYTTDGYQLTVVDAANKALKQPNYNETDVFISVIDEAISLVQKHNLKIHDRLSGRRQKVRSLELFIKTHQDSFKENKFAKRYV